MATHAHAVPGATGHAVAPAHAVHDYGLRSWLLTVDHKRIGILYGVTAFMFFLLGGIEALLIRFQLAVPNNTAVDPDTFNQLFTMHALTMIFLALMPLSAAFFNIAVPLLIGARDVAFPRLNAFSYWTFLLGGLLLNLSWIAGGAPDAGWFAYANLTSKEFSPGRGMDFYALGLQVLGVASMAAGLNFIVTILNMRAPGHDADAYARLRLDDARHVGADRPGVPRHHRRLGDVDAGPASRHQLLQPRRRR
jgi:cytochrome c oxidase subunit I